MALTWGTMGAGICRARSASKSKPVNHLCDLMSCAPPFTQPNRLVRSATRSFLTRLLAFLSMNRGKASLPARINWYTCSCFVQYACGASKAMRTQAKASERRAHTINPDRRNATIRCTPTSSRFQDRWSPQFRASRLALKTCACSNWPASAFAIYQP